MKKLTKYFLLIALILLATGLIIALFYIRLVYHSFVASESNFSNLFVQIIDKFSQDEPAPVIIPKPEETIQILEGWTMRDIGQYLETRSLYKNEDFLNITGFPQIDYRDNKTKPALDDFSTQFSFLEDKPKYYGLEGYLFPDTYRIYASSTVTEVIEKMLTNFDKKLTTQMRADIKAQGKTIYEVIILASLIEKEAPIDYQTSDDRDARIIAGIFLNRLHIGQGLQSDATLSYIYGDNKPAHTGAELENSSPYNTYKYRGLPPGPICNPGILAIKAAIYPIITEYNYFLTPKGKDTVVYARTYQEHLQNKYKYLK